MGSTPEQGINTQPITEIVNRALCRVEDLDDYEQLTTIHFYKKQVKRSIGPMDRYRVFHLINERLIILKYDIDCSTKFFSKRFVPQSIYIGGVVLINNGTNLKQKKKKGANVVIILI